MYAGYIARTRPGNVGGFDDQQCNAVFSVTYAGKQMLQSIFTPGISIPWPGLGRTRMR